jgi:DNA methylase
MSSTPIIPPGGMPPVPPHWREESDWIVLIEFLRQDDKEDRVRGTEAIRYMFAYSQMTDTRMLALVGDPKEDAYELLFSFSSPVNKVEFLRLLQSNDATACEEFEILVPDPSEIEAAQKPVPALAQLIRSFSLPGESVLDPFARSGSTCAAALLTGRKYIGMEMDDTYFQHASERLQRIHQRVAAK